MKCRHRVFYGKVEPKPTFQASQGFVVRSAGINCTFPEAGRYLVQVWFFQEQASDVLKGEMPFFPSQNKVHDMENRGRKIVRKSTLQVFKAIPITDPAEQAELDRRCEAAEKAMAAAARLAGKRKPPKRK